MGRGPALLALAIGICLAAPARAGVFDDFGFDPRGVAMGGAQVASADDYTAAYFNPALLVLQQQTTVGFGFSLAQPRMDVRSQAVGDAGRLRLPQGSQDFGGWTLGFLFPLAGKVHNRVAVGLGLYLPSNNLLRTVGVNPSEPFWYRYQSSPDRIIVAAGAGVRLTDWLSIGGGAQFLGALMGGFDFRVDVFSKQFERRQLQNDLELRVAPLAGLALDFPDLGLRVGLGYRGALQLDYSLPTVFDLADVGQIDLLMEGVVHYSPHTFTLGVQYRAGALTASAELRYGLWSRAPSPATAVAMNVDGDVLRALGLQDQLDVSASDASPGFADTLSPHLGVEYRLSERLVARAGYSFRPTPVPLQIGDTNILDGNTHALSAGVGLAVDDPLEVFSKPIHLEAAAQRLIIPERRADKSGTDPVPSYVYGGSVTHLSLAIRYTF